MVRQENISSVYYMCYLLAYVLFFGCMECFMIFVVCCFGFQNKRFGNNTALEITIRMSKNLRQDNARRYVRPN